MKLRRRRHSPAATPVEQLPEQDPGAATARNYDYQYGCAVIVLIRSLKERDYKEIWCEQHEDFLGRIDENLFDAYQVKTREDGGRPIALTTTIFVEAVTGFLRLQAGFPHSIRKYVFGSNGSLLTTKAGKKAHLSPTNLQEAAARVKSWDSLPKVAMRGFNALRKATKADPEALFKIVQGLGFMGGPSRKAFITEIAQQHLPLLPWCQLTQIPAQGVTQDLISFVRKASNLSSQDPIQHYPRFPETGSENPQLTRKRITSEEFEAFSRESAAYHTKNSNQAETHLRQRVDYLNQTKILLASDPFVKVFIEPLLADRKPGGETKHPRSRTGELAEIHETFDPEGRSLVLWSEKIQKPGGRILVLGAPGSGKTYATKRTVASRAERALDPLGMNDLPMWVNAKTLAGCLKRYHEDRRHPKHRPRPANLLNDSLLTPIFRAQDGLPGLPTIWNPTFLVIDGLDELSDPERKLVDDYILRWGQTSSVTLVVTCRTRDWQERPSAFIDQDDWEVFEICPLSTAQKRRFLDDQRCPLEVKERVSKWCSEDSRIKHELGSPQILAMACFLDQRYPLGDHLKVGFFYRSCLYELLRRGCGDTVAEVSLQPEEIVGIMEKACWGLFRASVGEECVWFLQSAWEFGIAQHLQKGKAPGQAGKLLKLLLKAGLLVESPIQAEDGRLIGFLHRGFFEYLAGKGFGSDKEAQTLLLIPPDSSIGVKEGKEVFPWWFSPSWGPVMQHLAENLSQKEGDQLLRRVLNSPLDPFAHRLWWAFRLTAAYSETPSEDLQEELFRQWAGLLQSSLTRQPWRFNHLREILVPLHSRLRLAEKLHHFLIDENQEKSLTLIQRAQLVTRLGSSKAADYLLANLLPKKVVRGSQARNRAFSDCSRGLREIGTELHADGLASYWDTFEPAERHKLARTLANLGGKEAKSCLRSEIEKCTSDLGLFFFCSAFRQIASQSDLEELKNEIESVLSSRSPAITTPSTTHLSGGKWTRALLLASNLGLISLAPRLGTLLRDILGQVERQPLPDYTVVLAHAYLMLLNQGAAWNIPSLPSLLTSTLNRLTNGSASTVTEPVLARELSEINRILSGTATSLAGPGKRLVAPESGVRFKEQAKALLKRMNRLSPEEVISSLHELKPPYRVDPKDWGPIEELTRGLVEKTTRELRSEPRAALLAGALFTRSLRWKPGRYQQGYRWGSATKLLREVFLMQTGSETQTQASSLLWEICSMSQTPLRDDFFTDPPISSTEPTQPIQGLD